MHSSVLRRLAVLIEKIIVCRTRSNSTLGFWTSPDSHKSLSHFFIIILTVYIIEGAMNFLRYISIYYLSYTIMNHDISGTNQQLNWKTEKNTKLSFEISQALSTQREKCIMPSSRIKSLSKDIMGVSEVSWNDSECYLYYSGKEDGKHMYGGVNKKVEKIY